MNSVGASFPCLFALSGITSLEGNEVPTEFIVIHLVHILFWLGGSGARFVLALPLLCHIHRSGTKKMEISFLFLVIFDDVTLNHLW